ncbi:Hypothetical_protein [Hexamita inflata]|uniref:Hypothetical_protein n=1 Tax=Hexamita inflata TaxID=28002 RepID=A0AA86Q207_9EUKA|nr:Hypothetical protein HINF_LOCUS31449 [Hexamita inflata]
MEYQPHHVPTLDEFYSVDIIRRIFLRRYNRTQTCGHNYRFYLVIGHIPEHLVSLCLSAKVRLIWYNNAHKPVRIFESHQSSSSWFVLLVVISEKTEQVFIFMVTVNDYQTDSRGFAMNGLAFPKPSCLSASLSQTQKLFCYRKVKLVVLSRSLTCMNLSSNRFKQTVNPVDSMATVPFLSIATYCIVLHPSTCGQLRPFEHLQQCSQKSTASHYGLQPLLQWQNEGIILTHRCAFNTSQSFYSRKLMHEPNHISLQLSSKCQGQKMQKWLPTSTRSGFEKFWRKPI